MIDKIIPISQLKLDTKNYRFDQLHSQRDAINVMINNQGGKLYKLAIDICENGFNPIDPILVVADNEKKSYIVLEGNRRVTALKIAFKPELIESKDDLKKKFDKLNADYRDKLDKIIDNIPCKCCSNREESLLWIERKHRGEMDGIGTVSWDAMQIRRFHESQSGKISYSTQIFNFIKSTNNSNINNAINSFEGITNLDRLLSDPDFRRGVGVYVEHGKLMSNINSEELARRILYIVQALSSPSFSVSKIYHKEDRSHFLEDISESFKNDSSVYEGQSWEVSSQSTVGNFENSDRSNKSVNKKGKKRERQTLIPKNFDINIEERKINRVFEELKGLNIQKFPNSVSVMFRVFLELLFDFARDKFSLTKGLSSASDGTKLEYKANQVITYLFNKKFIDRTINKGISHEIKTNYLSASIDSLNAYVHNYHFSPKPSELIICWDNIQEFISILCKIILQLEKKS